jgi:hypothetical protein
MEGEEFVGRSSIRRAAAARRPGKRYVEVPEMAEEEHRAAADCSADRIQRT